jgi:hypothetical protein
MQCACCSTIHPPMPQPCSWLRTSTGGPPSSGPLPMAIADAMCLLRNHTTDAFMTAARAGRVDVLRLLLDHPCADAAEMLTHAGPGGFTALRVCAADPRAVRARMPRDGACAVWLRLRRGGRRDHSQRARVRPHVGTARGVASELVARAAAAPDTLSGRQTVQGSVDCFTRVSRPPPPQPQPGMPAARLLLDHPSGTPRSDDARRPPWVYLLLTAERGEVDGMRLLDHPVRRPCGNVGGVRFWRTVPLR